MMLTNCGAGEDARESLGPGKEIQSILKEFVWLLFGRTDPDAEAQIYWPPNEDLLEKTPMLGKIEGKRRSGQQRMRWLDKVVDARNMYLGRVQEMVEERRARCAVVHGGAKGQT